MNYVFVYGTLRRGERNHYLLKNAKLLYEQAWTFGQLFDTPYHFPVLYESPNNKIYGELYEITEDELKLLIVWKDLKKEKKIIIMRGK